MDTKKRVRFYFYAFFIGIFYLISFHTCIAQWKQTTGPTGGEIWSLATDGTNLYAGTYPGGLFRSKNKGLSWESLNKQLPYNDIRSVTAAGTNIYASTNKGLFLSTDNGESWTSVSNGLTVGSGIYPGVESMAAIGNNLFAGTPGVGVFWSSNSGSVWRQINNGLADRSIYKIIAQGNYIYAATYSGVSRLTLNDTTWKSFNNALSSSMILSITATEKSLVASTITGLYVSYDNAESWKSVQPDLKQVNTLEYYKGKIYAGAYAKGVYISSDYGETWQNITNNLKQYFIMALTVNDSGIYVGNYQTGVFASYDNGATWQAARNGLIMSNVPIPLFADGNNLYAGVAGEIWKTTDNGETWKVISDNITCSSPLVEAFAKAGDKLLAAISDIKPYGGVYLSSDNGSSWQASNNKDLISWWVKSLAVKGNDIFVSSLHGINHSANFGANWDTLINGLTSTSVYNLLISGNDIYANSYPGGLFISTDNGAKWTQITNDIPKTQALALAAIDSNVFASYQQGVYLYRTTNKGLNWKAVDKGISGAKDFAVKGKNLFASTGSGVFLSTDLGESWKPVNEGLAISGLSSIAVNDKYLYAATYNGVFVRKLSDMITSVNDNNSFPEGFSLKQNFPNPFNPVTVISYSIPKQSYVELKVYDMLGREAAALVNKEQSKGNYQVKFDASPLPSGI